MSVSLSLRISVSAAIVAVAGCGGSTPPPKAEDSVRTDAPPREDTGGGPVVEQELGSIDPRAVEQTFDKLLNGSLESCHKQGRSRIEYLSGEAKVFLRVGKDGHVKYTFFDESTIGDRDTEKCVLDALTASDWPKPRGGEAEVRSNFSWTGGDERQPASWAPDKASNAIAGDHDAKGAVEKCKGGIVGTFRITAYVEPGEPDPPAAAVEEPPAKGPKKGAPGQKITAAKPKDKHGGGGKSAEHGGRFKAVGVTPPGKEGADKVDCIVDALKAVPLPSPGSYVAKVTFAL